MALGPLPWPASLADAALEVFISLPEYNHWHMHGEFRRYREGSGDGGFQTNYNGQAAR